jgi:hypothetical protein
LLGNDTSGSVVLGAVVAPARTVVSYADGRAVVSISTELVVEPCVVGVLGPAAVSSRGDCGKLDAVVPFVVAVLVHAARSTTPTNTSNSRLRFICTLDDRLADSVPTPVALSLMWDNGARRI